MTKTQPVSYD